ncbi:hypothetical protein L596_030079 [Steinernema carpocapsae]|uniref:Uncharacterized protein n=1 Tax=Steinernema carpocapsae TaxID=34508 RepID=A0A4U5LRN4_STECR|nr:hypothetical protein L596_030079 [Steinernema carpocapsae]
MVYEQLSMLRWYVDTANKTWMSMAEAHDTLNDDDNNIQIVEKWQQDYVPNQDQSEDPKEVPCPGLALTVDLTL